MSQVPALSSHRHENGGGIKQDQEEDNVDEEEDDIMAIEDEVIMEVDQRKEVSNSNSRSDEPKGSMSNARGCS